MNVNNLDRSSEAPTLASLGDGNSDHMAIVLAIQNLAQHLLTVSSTCLGRVNISKYRINADIKNKQTPFLSPEQQKEFKQILKNYKRLFVTEKTFLNPFKQDSEFIKTLKTIHSTAGDALRQQS